MRTGVGHWDFPTLWLVDSISQIHEGTRGPKGVCRDGNLAPSEAPIGGSGSKSRVPGQTLASVTLVGCGFHRLSRARSWVS